MNSNDILLFTHLKNSVIKTFLERHNAPTNVKDWTGNDIVIFQEDLFHKVKARVSEKWFYTYFKNDAKKLPRVDMLNLLSQYVGSKNWSDFKAQQHSKTDKKTKFFWLSFIPVALIIISMLFWKNSAHTFNFCFVNDINGEAIKDIRLDIKILNGNESPIYLKSDDNGCISYKSKDEYITFVVQSPYHKTDTIIKSINNLKNGKVKINTDDYALMLDYYSNKKVVNWKAHRKNLDNIFSSNALIYQVFPNNIGVELYTKDEFINKLTIPTQSLKQMKILSKSYANGKIVKLKFTIE